MRKRGEIQPSGIDLASLVGKDHTLGRDVIVHADNQITVGFGIDIDKRVINREVVKNTNVIIVSPVEIDIVTFGPKGSQTHEPFEEAQGFKATKLHAKLERRVAQASSYFLDYRRDPQASGRLLKLSIRTGNEDLNSYVVASNADVESIHTHIPFLLSPEYIVFQV